MKQNILQNIGKLFTVILLTFTFSIGSAYAENIDERDKLFAEAALLKLIPISNYSMQYPSFQKFCDPQDKFLASHQKF